MGKTKSGNRHVPFRLNLLFFAVFLLFSLLIFRLGYIQIVQGDQFESNLEESSAEQQARIDAPRGLMYDRNGNIVVDNELALSLTYTNKQSVSTDERLEIADALVDLISIETDDNETLNDKIDKRTKQDYWIATHPEEAKNLVTAKEQAQAEEDEDENALYNLQLSRISEEQLSSLNSELKKVYIWGQMVSGYYDTPYRIKKDLSRNEAHQISERLDALPGVNILRDAQRQYLYDDAFPDYFGNIGSIPREQLDQYLAEGYARTDEVGTSFLEQQYENDLRGKKGTVTNGNTSNGRRGNDLVLSIDMALQQQVNTIVQEELNSMSTGFINNPNAYIVMMEPETGEILTTSGYQDQLGITSKSYEMGSTVKPATVMTGLETGAVTPQTTIVDRPLDLAGAEPISSVYNMGPVNYYDAIVQSSNIYMSYVAMNMAGYSPGTGQSWSSSNYKQAYATLRYYYSQFGLGAETGIDLPSESTGITGPTNTPGRLLYLSFGQFDTYTPLQLGQYVSTIANDGYRMQPRLVKGIRQPNPDKQELGAVKKQFEPNIMNKLDINNSYIDRVQEAMRGVVSQSRGSAHSEFNGADYAAAGKTGTAEVTIRQQSTGNSVDGINQAFISYAPYDNPEVTAAVVVPGLYESSNVAKVIGRRALDAYFNLKENPQAPESEETQEESGTNGE
ncbi:peptidoglycan D,D-transpeptidase FtsI family protein [Salibacterium qingdaonense]|uniref:serine-type D-Ala-D-Ala carboxypeptidase n=1 Tax=Salibacterium qingdaonense TaxID=266892 RepID=A0A1I4JLZ8_9BACI|nr:penicillin-binding protein 2 [Salibacterium qingdaonense]SFL67237.1 Cell division protein FtsI/penicillin-binding protein 2 [Salibacterium qingdaonense]